MKDYQNRPLKALAFGKIRGRGAGRNSEGRITIFHRGGGAKRLQRRIDFRRNRLYTGKIERIEYDPNRSSRIALVRWSTNSTRDGSRESMCTPSILARYGEAQGGVSPQGASPKYFTYILASEHSKVGDNILNLNQSSLAYGEKGYAPLAQDLLKDIDENFDQQTGNCLQLSAIPIGSNVHNVELHPGRGGQLVRAAGCVAKLVQKTDQPQGSILELPSGVRLSLDSRCKATIGIVMGASRSKLVKAGQSRWLGKRPVVRGVAMNPVDHPHGGGEGRAKGRISVSPWGKPTKGGFKTVMRKTHSKL